MLLLMMFLWLALTGGGNSGVVNIGFSQTTYTVNEGRGLLQLEINIEKVQNKTAAINIEIRVESGTAKKGEDFHVDVKSVERMTFSPGNNIILNVTLVNDDLIEDNERFSVSLSSTNKSVNIVNSTAVITIVDNDGIICEIKCDVNAECIGPNICRCKPGYSGNGRNCSDINECIQKPCDLNAQCTNIFGSFVCTCNNGYSASGDGFSCADVNECNNSPCKLAFSKCENTPGSYKCSCQYGRPLIINQTLTICRGACLEEKTGEAVTQGVFFWNTTEGDSVVFRNCPYGSNENQEVIVDDLQGQSLPIGGASRRCQCNDNDCQQPYWNEPKISRCKYRVYNDSEITDALSTLYQDIDKNRTSLVNASMRLATLTNDSKNFKEDDVALTVLILENIVKGTNVLNETGTNIIQAVDNFLNIDPAVLFQSQETINSSTRVLSVVEDYLENVAINPQGNVQQNEQNIAVYARDVNQSTFQGVGAESLISTKKDEKNNLTVYNNINDFSVQPTVSQVSLTMPKSLFENLNTGSEAQNQRIAFVVYQKSSLFQSQVKETTDGETINKLNSLVISGSVKGETFTNLQDPIITTYQPLDEGIYEKTACVFWDFSLKNGVGDWSQAGCNYKEIKDGIVTCHCSHLTNFAILMDVYITDRIDEDHDRALSIISYIGCAISLGGLVLTIITILLFKDFRTKAPTQILLNICIALSLTLIVFIVAAERSKTSSTNWCRAAAIALHYFVLAAFMWMAIEAYNMYIRFVKILPTHHSYFMIKCLIFGWGLPAIIVVVTAVLEFKEYGGDNYCRLQGVPFQTAFLGPVLLVLLVNLIAFILILRSLLTSETKVTADRKTSGITQARRAIAILVVLGLTWLFGILAIRDAKLVFQYLFCIFNSVQGLLVFIFHCVLSKDIRKKWKSLYSSKGKLETSSGRHHHYVSDSKFHEVTLSCNNTGSSSMTSSSNNAGFATNHVDSIEMQ